MTPRLWVGQEAARFVMWIARRQPLDERPKVANPVRAVAPTGKIGVAVGEGEGGREVETDQHVRVRGQQRFEPCEHFAPRPDMTGTDQPRRRRAARYRQRDPLVPRAAGARPVDGGEMGKAAHAPS